MILNLTRVVQYLGSLWITLRSYLDTNKEYVSLYLRRDKILSRSSAYNDTAFLIDKLRAAFALIGLAVFDVGLLKRNVRPALETFFLFFFLNTYAESTHIFRHESYVYRNRSITDPWNSIYLTEVYLIGYLPCYIR